jgi:hypothetical protein
LILNAAVFAPAATVTLAGTVATDVVSLANETAKPPAGAAASRVTFPATEFPP